MIVGRSSRKKQVVVYLPHALHQRLRVQAAHMGKSISQIVESALRDRLEERPRVQLPADLDTAPPQVVDALAQHGAPLWSSGRPTGLSVEDAIAQGLVAAHAHASLLHVLPIVLERNKELLSWPELRARVETARLPALGMLLDLAAEVTGTARFRAWAAELWDAGVRQEPERPFFAAPGAGARYLELARQRTPEAVRRWGFLMVTPIDDFRDAVRRHCPELPSSIAPS
jgi:plasmid stability protein